MADRRNTGFGRCLPEIPVLTSLSLEPFTNNQHEHRSNNRNNNRSNNNNNRTPLDRPVQRNSLREMVSRC